MTALCSLLSPHPHPHPPLCLARPLLRGVRWKPMEPWPGGWRRGTASSPAAHPPLSRACPPGRGPQCSLVRQLAPSSHVSRVAPAGRQCQPWRPEMPGWGGGCAPPNPPGPGPCTLQETPGLGWDEGRGRPSTEAWPSVPQLAGPGTTRPLSLLLGLPTKPLVLGKMRK